MGYVRAMSSVARGYSLRRAAWMVDEHIYMFSNELRKYTRVETGGFRWRRYEPTHEDQFASDWELVA